MKTTLEKCLAAIEGAAAGAHPQLIEIPEWLNWATCDELTRLEQVFRDAAAAMSDELGEADQHRVMAIYSGIMARMCEASPEVRADPDAVDAYVRAIEEVRPVIDRGPPKSCRTAEHKPQDAVLRDRGGLFEPSGLASRTETAHGARSGSRHMGNVGLTLWRRIRCLR